MYVSMAYIIKCLHLVWFLSRTFQLQGHTPNSTSAHLHPAPELGEDGGDDHVLLYILHLFFRRPQVLQEHLLAFPVHTYDSINNVKMFSRRFFHFLVYAGNTRPYRVALSRNRFRLCPRWRRPLPEGARLSSWHGHSHTDAPRNACSRTTLHKLSNPPDKQSNTCHSAAQTCYTV